MSYKSRAGSVADRAIAHMRSIGVDIAARPLADEIDVDLDTLHTSLVLAVNAGVVVKERRDDGLVWYCLGDGQPLRVRDEEEPLGRPPAPSPPTNRKARAPASGTLRFGHWSTGELAIERGGEVVDVFTKDEAAQFFEFARRVAGASA